MATSKERDKEQPKGHIAMKTPPIVSEQEWEAARQQLLVKEKAFTRFLSIFWLQRGPRVIFIDRYTISVIEMRKG